MSKFFMAGLCVFLPWLALLFCDNPLGALVALPLQLSILGWPVATVWAFQAVHEHTKAKSDTQKEMKREH